MRAAPPVDVPVSTGRVERAATALLYAAAALAASIAAASLLDRRAAWLSLAAVAGCAAILGAGVWRPPRGRLRWDGQAWSLVHPSGQVRPLVGLQVQLDLGSWILLRWHGDGERWASWASLRAAHAGAAWHGLRVALAAHGRPGRSRAVGSA